MDGFAAAPAAAPEVSKQFQQFQQYPNSAAAAAVRAASESESKPGGLQSTTTKPEGSVHIPADMATSGQSSASTASAAAGTSQATNDPMEGTAGTVQATDDPMQGAEGSAPAVIPILQQVPDLTTAFANIRSAAEGFVARFSGTGSDPK